METGAIWLLMLLQLTVMTSHGARVTTRRPSAPAAGGGSSCHVTQTGTGCRYALSLIPLKNGGASCGQPRRHGNVTSSSPAMPADGDVIADKLDDAVVKVTRMMKQLSVRCLRHLRQIKADLRKVRHTLCSPLVGERGCMGRYKHDISRDVCRKNWMKFIVTRYRRRAWRGREWGGGVPSSAD